MDSYRLLILAVLFMAAHAVKGEADKDQTSSNDAKGKEVNVDRSVKTIGWDGNSDPKTKRKLTRKTLLEDDYKMNALFSLIYNRNKFGNGIRRPAVTERHSKIASGRNLSEALASIDPKHVSSDGLKSLKGNWEKSIEGHILADYAQIKQSPGRRLWLEGNGSRAEDTAGRKVATTENSRADVGGLEYTGLAYITETFENEQRQEKQGRRDGLVGNGGNVGNTADGVSARVGNSRGYVGRPIYAGSANKDQETGEKEKARMAPRAIKPQPGSGMTVGMDPQRGFRKVIKIKTRSDTNVENRETNEFRGDATIERKSDGKRLTVAMRKTTRPPALPRGDDDILRDYYDSFRNFGLRIRN